MEINLVSGTQQECSGIPHSAAPVFQEEISYEQGGGYNASDPCSSSSTSSLNWSR